MQYRLFRDGGEFVMYAEVRFVAKEVCFFMYDPDDKENSLYDPERPAFSMQFDDSKTAWVMSHFLDGAWSSPKRATSGSRQGRQEEVLFVEHSKDKVGEGINYGLNAEFTSKCSELGSSSQLDADGKSMHKLVSRQAVWNEELQTLVLDFREREVIPSAKNFQVVREGANSRVVCQHGKISSNTFALDFRAPLSIAQAFAMSVTTLFWE
jgi:hypothetical protein